MTTFNVEGWYDCGKKETLLETNRFLLTHIKTVNNKPNAIIVPPVYISPSSKIVNSVIGPYVSVGDNAVIESSIIKDSIISSGAMVKHCLLESSLVGNNSVFVGRYHKLNLGDSSEIDF
jgi:glucose-1-phosphate thymidylyltransferase